MKKIHFLFGIHNHQPVGNFEHIFKKSFSTCYKPFFSLLEKHPHIKTSIHFSGPLLEWMESEEPDFVERIQKLVAQKQVELLSGGFYEPIFSILREPDVLGQIGMTNDFIQKKFRTKPRGAWLPERVWDPVLPRLLCEGGLSYTLLDNTHFLHTGLSPEQIRGYFVTEREGKTLAVFPTDMNLRYSIPFEPPDKTIEYLRYLASDMEDAAVSYGDNGEKFGMWPGTYSWVYEKGWLEAFFTALEKNRAMIEMLTFSEYLDKYPPQGLIYLPTLSYEEMMEWALPAEAAARYEDMLGNLQNLELKDKYSPFLRGGYWNNFLVKYPESNHMHKKMLMISERLDEWQKSIHGSSGNGQVRSAKKELYQGQCNCPYWHGLFGGIYLNYLRHAIYEHLINAEKIIDLSLYGDEPWVDYKVTDFKRDRSMDVLISGKNLNAYFSLNDGGSLFELDFKQFSFNLSNTLTRKMEGYHRKLKLNNGAAESNGRNEQPVSIHHTSKIKEEGLQNLIAYDWYQRYSFIDHFLGEGTTPETFSLSRYPETGNFVGSPYALEKIEKDLAKTEVSFMLKRDGHILQDDKQMPLRIEKSFSVNDTLMEIQSAYSIKNKSGMGLELWFGVEFNFAFIAGNDPLCNYHFPGHNENKLLMNTKGDFLNIPSFEIKDEGNGFGVKFSISPAADVGIFPLETVSQSEDGLERTYQGSTILLHWKIPIKRGAEQKRSLKLSLFKLKSLEDAKMPGLDQVPEKVL
jgi:alpha-amylase